MPAPIQLKIVETYKEVPIIEVRYPRPTLLTRETHREQIQALLDQPAETMAVIISYNNLSCSSRYGPPEQAVVYESEESERLARRVVCVIRYQARSLTTLVSTMSAHSLMEAGGPSNFAPDLDSSVRAARRAIEAYRTREPETVAMPQPEEEVENA